MNSAIPRKNTFTHNLKSNCNNLHCLWKNFTFLQELYVVVIIMWVGENSKYVSVPFFLWTGWLELLCFQEGGTLEWTLWLCVHSWIPPRRPYLLLHFPHYWLYTHVIPHTHTHKKNYKIVINYYISSPSESSVAAFRYITPTFHDPFNSRRIIQFCTKLYPLKCLTF